MKIKLFTLLLAVAASVGTMFAETVQIGDLYYNLDATNHTAKVTSSSDKYSGDIIIPSSVTYNSITCSVTSIGDRAFQNCVGMTSVSIPNSVTSIGYCSFEGCTGLTSLTIPNSVKSLERHSFQDCTGLTSVTLGNSVTKIMGDAFYRCTGLTSIEIPNSVTSIGDNAFKGTSLTGVYISSLEAWCNISFEGSGSGTNPLYVAQNLYLNGTLVTNLVIPEGIISIKNMTFYGCRSIRTVTIPTSVASIGEKAFFGCVNLTSLDIPNGVSSISDYAFKECTNLISITLPSTLTSVGTDIFLDCTNLANIYVPCDEISRFFTLLNNDTRVKLKPLPYKLKVLASENGSVTYPETLCDEMKLEAIPDYGYHFVKWNDGNTANPRNIVLTQDTIFSVEFAPNIYSFSVTCNENYGSVQAVNGNYDYLTELTISATPKYGYHFIRWSDGNTSNPRTYILKADVALEAIFEPNIYSISALNNPNGEVTGTGSLTYLTECSITAIPNYGYHFVKWNDGNTANPRNIVLTQDTIFAPVFGVDRSGKCGDDFALTWNYDNTDKSLTISGNGSLNSNYTFGVEAPTNVERLIIAKGVTSIGNSAFANYATLRHISLDGSVKTIYEQAFYNCTGLQEIYSYRATPPTAYSNTFDGIDKFECTLYVLAASVDMYKASTGWRDFYYIQAIEGAEAIDVIQSGMVKATKLLRNGQILILRGDRTYTLTGQQVK